MKFMLALLLIGASAHASVTTEIQKGAGKIYINNGVVEPILSSPIIGLNGTTFKPVAVDSSGNLMTASGSAALPNSAGSIANNAAVGTVAVTFSKPANAVGFILEAENSNTDNIRWAVGSVATSSVGVLTEPGRDTGYVPLAANISVIALSGTQSVSVQWVLSN